MTSTLLVSRHGGKNLERKLISHFTGNDQSVVAIGVAYISSYGARFVDRLALAASANDVRLVFDTRDCVTHPNALRHLLGEGYHLRQVNDAAGTFHCKFICSGTSFDAEGRVTGTRSYSIGSGNLSLGALSRNTEASFLRSADHNLEGASAAYASMWVNGIDMNAADIDDYEVRFAERNRQRSSIDLVALGVADRDIGTSTANQILDQKSPTEQQRSYRPSASRAAWAGLQSFTGDYTLQVEFPQAAGRVLRDIFLGLGLGQNVPIVCSDGVTRVMRYRYYDDNAMFRLNIPNDVPGAAQARQSHSGIAMVELETGAQPTLRLSIIHQNQAIDDIARRSEALGTWGKTTTRAYGWF